MKLLRPLLGAYKLRELSGVQVSAALKTIAEDHTSRSVALCKNTLERAIRLAQAQDKVSRNVAEVVKTPAGRKASKPRQAFSLEEMLAILKAGHAPWVRFSLRRATKSGKEATCLGGIEVTDTAEPLFTLDDADARRIERLAAERAALHRSRDDLQAGIAGD